MKRGALGNFLSFLLALVITMTTVMTLSMITQAQADPAAAVAAVEQAAEAGRSASQMSASVSQGIISSPLLCVVGFVLILLFVMAGLLLYRWAKRRGKSMPRGRRYKAREDMAFSNSSKNRV